jgi:hypothetical protein
MKQSSSAADIQYVRSEVFRAVIMKNVAFWDVALVSEERRFAQDLNSATSQKTAFFK